MTKNAILIVLDGWGLGAVQSADAIRAADTPYIDFLHEFCPKSELITCGKKVGLPEGQMGNSEVGHLNIGAGRIVWQELERINQAVASADLFKEKALLEAVNYAKTNKKKLHLIGLLSDGGVHSHIAHLKAITQFCDQEGVEDLFIHAFTDGRDCDPKSGIGFVEDLEESISASSAKLASVCGRFFAMDRDKRWERVKKAYDCLVSGIGKKSNNATQSIQESYDLGVTDEFLEPIVLYENDEIIAKIEEGDAVLCFNFRTDRCREITQVLTQEDFASHGMKKMELHFTTMTEYDKSFEGVNVIYHKEDIKHTLGEVLSAHSKKQIRIAETEKYPHVTFFFSGGRENEFEGEKRIMIPSPQDVLTYDLKPEMSAIEMTEAILPEIENETADFIILNFANTDMVGHTGVWEAVVKAAETVDECVRRISESALAKDYTLLITADHGNSDFMINEDGSANTAHTLNPVPLFVLSNSFKGKVKDGILADLAPTVLSIMDIPIPEEMTGSVLVE